MFVLYMRSVDTYDYEIFMRLRVSLPSTMFNNESMWMVPGTVSADD
jgi:hypothetical protein